MTISTRYKGGSFTSNDLGSLFEILNEKIENSKKPKNYYMQNKQYLKQEPTYKMQPREELSMCREIMCGYQDY